ncbi:hypothetical protein COX05_01520 [candidate division WWE3 bacterium CG22_combo_CG10-13_8_21_14_all_39_12]|uniref:DUF5659 domain-containing protein n=1 Tax=candidate division WWE3 bacterium CG22_combo_CG10-13_8_21_14_all_39_12 TaxID=1975094 RepID=A0A2H0BGC4_UNCKA|nr:MAG: hypothetical protein COX05_01520 [candidate division WWE3 bacterium CG22_combo_CG10-13_8_21_14_all_39_12]
MESRTNIKLTDYYATSDLSLAAAIALFFPLEAVDRINPSKSQFLFKRNEHLDQLIENFWRNELTVEPQAYFNQIKAIKSRLYTEKY